MSDEIAQEIRRSSMKIENALENAQNVTNAEFNATPNESAETVPIEENKLKRKQEESDEANSKLEAEMQGEKKKSKLVKEEEPIPTITTAGTKYQSDTANFALTLPDFAKLCAKQEHFDIYSDPIHMAGYNWKLKAEKLVDSAWLGLFLHLYPPEHFKGPYEFDVSMCSPRRTSTNNAPRSCTCWWLPRIFKFEKDGHLGKWAE